MCFLRCVLKIGHFPGEWVRLRTASGVADGGGL